ncbi:glycohydrolase toxin TNT-related protein [Streptococcus sp. DTU_2020_1000888_1_SI_GRL_NUU_041A]|nr:glycohydrolase toxin TNT-related protein [Streptococcus sp. DTU_2020_1000888_1_SI_GRL_NUU_041A]WNU93827.1 glycohydrolase toxin TNT-related protein [Streptococcus sp. DTU_2020_1000888_1_SI_GRL_NUU_041A]
MKNKPKITYIATKPIPNKKGLIAPWFDESGMGIQHFTDMEVGYLMNNGYLKIIE